MSKPRKKLKLRRFDAAEHLESERDCAIYLQAIVQEADGDERLITSARNDVARARRRWAR